ncbi:MAG: hypothetical protein DMF12_06260 [Verrucomicrobia bacterium]|nr:MAG: hypothetical protein DMF12_06260 [Verrucomicrobiota bacterium]
MKYFERGCRSDKLFLRHKLGDRQANFAKQKPILVECPTDEPLKVRVQQKKEETHEDESFFKRCKGTGQAAVAG